MRAIATTTARNPAYFAWLGNCSGRKKPTDRSREGVAADGGHVQVPEVRQDLAEVHELLRYSDEEERLVRGGTGSAPAR
jgi:hypothetical protein